jgi:hypothetical protein
LVRGNNPLIAVGTAVGTNMGRINDSNKFFINAKNEVTTADLTPSNRHSWSAHEICR